MFKSKSTSDNLSEKLPTGNGSATIISSGTMLKGDINSESDLRIDGKLKGNITSTAKIVIGATGIVDGDLVANQIDILGKVSGNVKAKELLQLKENAEVFGNIYSVKLQVSPTATFNGQCHMPADDVKVKMVESLATETEETLVLENKTALVEQN